MNSTHIALGCAALALACSVALQAQADLQDPDRRVSAAVALHAETDVVPLHEGRAGWLAGGADYKVRFGADVAFVPYLGRSVPTNRELAWTTRAVTRGGVALALEAAQLVVDNTRRRAEYRRGLVRETWDVRAEGVEQRFVFDQAVPGTGDLVVEGAIVTALRAVSRAPAHGPLRFGEVDGAVRVEYGAAFVFDAAGRRAEIATGLDGDTIRLVVPGAWLAEATWPVTIDPLLAPVVVDGGSTYESVEVARDSTHDEVMIVRCRAASATDLDGFAHVYADDFSMPDLVFADLSLGWSTRSMDVAATGASRTWVVGVARDAAASGGPWRVGYHVHAGGDRSFDATVAEVVPTVSGHDWRVVVGGTAADDPADAAVLAWQREPSGAALGHEVDTSDIWCAVLDLSGGAPVLTPETRLDVMGPFVPADHERPCVNKVGEASRPWIVGWQRATRDVPGGGAWQLFARQVDEGGVVGHYAYGDDTAAPATHHRMMPRLAGRRGLFMWSWVRVPVAVFPTPPTEHHGDEVGLRRMRWGHFNGIAVRWDLEMLHANPGAGPRAWHTGGMSFDPHTRSHWVVPAVSERHLGGDGSVHVTRVAGEGLPTDAQTLHVGQAGEQNTSVAAVFDTDANETVFALGVNEATGLAGQVVGRRYSYTPAPPITTHGVGCTPALIEWVDSHDWLAPGSQQIGSEYVSVRLAGATVNHALCFLVIGFQPASLDLSSLGLPGCHAYVPLGGPGHIGTVLNNTALGYRVVSLPVPAGLPPTTLFLQWFYQVTPGALDLRSTYRLEVPLVK